MRVYRREKKKGFDVWEDDELFLDRGIHSGPCFCMVLLVLDLVGHMYYCFHTSCPGGGFLYFCAGHLCIVCWWICQNCSTPFMTLKADMMIVPGLFRKIVLITRCLLFHTRQGEYMVREYRDLPVVYKRSEFFFKILHSLFHIRTEVHLYAIS